MDDMTYLTLGEVVEAFDALVPNAFPREEKFRWIGAFDGQIWQELFCKHEGAQGSWVPYEPHEGDRRLLIPEPFGRELYLALLENRTDHFNGDTARYNNSLDRLSGLHRSFCRWYHSRIRPLGGKRKFW